MSGTVILFDIESTSNNFIRKVVDELITISQSTFLLRPTGVQPLSNSLQIYELTKSWPRWVSRPWVVAGRSSKESGDVLYKGPFIEDCRGKGYNEQVNGLLREFDWAIFSYFTTFQSDVCSFITSDITLTELPIFKALKDGACDLHQFDSNPIECLRTATFYDYDVEGLFPYEAAKLRGEQSPLLLCSIALQSKDLYHKWNHEKDECEESVWFQQPIEQLETVDEFVTDYMGYKFKHCLFRVNAVTPYLDIWGEASYDHSIAEATLSADTDFSALKKYLENKCSFEINRELDQICTWSYGQVYGGGADEHHAIFRSCDSDITQQIWEMVGEEQISRF
ncbi:hypothetical protein BTA51_20040 [Hahella sp. CCB-MM4]|uniref:hypothetical protein n=1 Tax=Hahella sp. (strain CCB-MM4) TaxID=1926491 RepID=UPI000BD7D50D|nr:hypothetical protein [Hahella sp. CCB-MM4]OZG71575.1 hypothetical protein BTA51_20040 [Hahella sp. CCB-MM4]